MRKLFVLAFGVIIFFSACEDSIFGSGSEPEVSISSTKLIGGTKIKVTLLLSDLSESGPWEAGYYYSKSANSQENKNSQTLETSVAFVYDTIIELEANTEYYITPFLQDGNEYVEGAEVSISTGEKQLAEVNVDITMPQKNVFFADGDLSQSYTLTISEYGLIVGTSPDFKKNDAIVSRAFNPSAYIGLISLGKSIMYFNSEAITVYVKVYAETADGISYSEEQEFELQTPESGDIVAVEEFLTDEKIGDLNLSYTDKIHNTDGSLWLKSDEKIFLVDKDGYMMQNFPISTIPSNYSPVSTSIAKNSSNILKCYSTGTDGNSDFHAYLNLYSQSGSSLWNTEILSEQVFVKDIAINENGTIYLIGNHRSYFELLGSRLEGSGSFIAAIDSDKNLLFLFDTGGSDIGVEIDDNGVAYFAQYSYDLFDNGDVRLMPEHTTIFTYNESTQEFAIKAYDMNKYSLFYMDADNNMFLVETRGELKITKLNSNGILEWTKSFPVIRDIVDYVQISDFYCDSDNNVHLTANPIFGVSVDFNGRIVSDFTLIMNENGDIKTISKGYSSMFSLVNSNSKINTYLFGHSGYDNIKATIK